MSFLEKLDPTGNNFLGLGNKIGRIAGSAVIPDAEIFRKDPFGMKSDSVGGKVSHGIAGAGEGAVGGAAGGFATGGPYGAVAGAIGGGITGGVRSGLGDSDPTSLAGHGGGAAGNFGIGLGIGSLAGSFSGAGGTSTSPASGGTSAPGSQAPAASGWENHASQMRYAGNALPPGGSGYNTQKPQQQGSPVPMMPYPTIKE